MFKENKQYKPPLPKLCVKDPWQNRPVIWFVAKREGYNGMMQNNDIAEDSTDAILKELLAKEKDTLSQKNSLKVYPNPFEDYFVIESSVIDKMVIQEPSGRIVLQKEVSKGENIRSEEHTSELQSRPHLVCRLLLEKKKKKK